MTKEVLAQSLKEAQLCGETLKVSVLRLVLAALQTKETEKRTKLSKTEPLEKLDGLSQLTEEEILNVLSSEAKKRRESIEAFQKGNRLELAAREEKELKFLESYLPAGLTEEELRALVKESISQTKAQSLKDLGRVMSDLAPKTRNRADGQQVSQIVKEALSQN